MPEINRTYRIIDECWQDNAVSVRLVSNDGKDVWISVQTDGDIDAVDAQCLVSEVVDRARKGIKLEISDSLLCLPRVSYPSDADLDFDIPEHLSVDL